jgi:hypothetical protein
MTQEELGQACAEPAEASKHVAPHPITAMTPNKNTEAPAETLQRLTDEEVEQGVREKLQTFFGDSPLLEADASGKNLLEKILTRTDAGTERKIFEGLTLLETDEKLLALRLKVLPDLSTVEEKEQKKLIHDFVERFEQHKHARGALMAFLSSLAIRETKGKAGPAFIDEEHAKVDGKFITSYLNEIEGYIDENPPQKGSTVKNPLYYKGGPHFRNIDAYIANLANIERAGIKDKHPEAVLALERVQNLKIALENKNSTSKFDPVKYNFLRC